jgi:xylulokinase
MIWLAIDIGTTGTKAVLLDEAQNMLASAYKDYETTRAPNGEVEQNPLDWLHAVLETTRALSSHATFSNVSSIVVTGQMQNMTLVDKTGKPLRPTILYSDSRATREAEHINDLLNADELYSLTGNEQDSSSLLAKLLWLKKHEAQHLETAEYVFLGAADVIAFWLTEQAITDTTTASTTGLMGLQTRAYLTLVFSKLGLESISAKLPELHNGGQLIGNINHQIAEQLSLSTETRVYLAPGDAGSTTLGAGCGELGHAYAYLGTSGWVAFSSEGRAKERGVFTLAHPHPKRFIQIAPLLTAGGNLQWIRDLFSSNDYEGIIAEAFSSQATSLLYLPYLNGERCPLRDPLARGVFVGLSSTTTRAEMVRAVLEGIVFNYRHALQTLCSSFPKSLTLTGGGTRSAAWCQLFADILGIPTQVVKDAEHVGVRGAQLAALAASGQRKDYLAKNECVTFEPNQNFWAHYANLYDAYLDLYPALKKTFKKLQRVGTQN